MKVLHVTPSFYPALVYGGPMYSVYQLCVHLLQSGCDVRVLTTNANGPNAILSFPNEQDVELPGGLKVRYCKRIVPDSISQQMLQLLPEYLKWADVVHLMAVYSFPIIPTLFLCRILGKPVVWSPRGMLQRWEGSTHVWLKKIWESFCRIVAPQNISLHVTSEEEARESQERMPGISVSIIPNSVPIPESVSHRESASGLRFLYLGRLHPKKGIENLLHAFKMLNGPLKENSTVTIAGAGDPDYTKTILSKIEALNLRDRVHMIGPVEDREKTLAFENADVVVVPSYTENFGMVVAEALAHEVPVVASKGTPWRRLEEKGCGLWVDNRPENLASAMEQLCGMQLRQMGIRGREWMEQEFAGPLVAAKMVGLYRQVLNHS